jgi:hypothetical protein
MSGVGRVAYGVRMHDIDPLTRQAHNPLRHPCAACTHSEFVHADGDPRECLFSECACRSFAGQLAAAGRRRRSAA